LLPQLHKLVYDNRIVQGCAIGQSHHTLAHRCAVPGTLARHKALQVPTTLTVVSLPVKAFFGGCLAKTFDYSKTVQKTENRHREKPHSKIKLSLRISVVVLLASVVFRQAPFPPKSILPAKLSV